MTRLERALVRAVVALAPARLRESLEGDLLELERGRTGECLRSAGPLALERVRRAGPTRIALTLASGMFAAALVHAAGAVAWQVVLDGVPLRADHAASLPWRLVTLTLELVAAGLGAGAVVASGLARKGTER